VQPANDLPRHRSTRPFGRNSRMRLVTLSPAPADRLRAFADRAAMLSELLLLASRPAEALAAENLADQLRAAGLEWFPR
jgi:hypothetical protein